MPRQYSTTPHAIELRARRAAKRMGLVARKSRDRAYGGLFGLFDRNLKPWECSYQKTELHTAEEVIAMAAREPIAKPEPDIVAAGQPIEGLRRPPGKVKRWTRKAARAMSQPEQEWRVTLTGTDREGLREVLNVVAGLSIRYVRGWKVEPVED